MSAETLSPTFYTSRETWKRLQAMMSGCWLWAGDTEGPKVEPVELGREPLLLVRDEGEPRLLSNVCTHRWAILIREPQEGRIIRCEYHGRRFDLDGRPSAAPGFPFVPDAPLARAHAYAWRRFVFGNLAPKAPFPVEALESWLGFLPWDKLVRAPKLDSNWSVAAHWALYVDNYLEGLHIPFVHPGLAGVVAGYRTVLVPGGVMQIADARPEDPALLPPAGHPEAGSRLAALYLWLFPTTMLNVYPWGMSLNVVDPMSPERTRIRFRVWTWDPDKLGQGAGAELDGVELEDEGVVESVQRGVASRLAQPGQFSPTEEIGPRFFHDELRRRLQWTPPE